MTTGIGLFDRVEDARRAVEALLKRGFVKDEIGVIADARAGLADTLSNMGVPGDDAHIYAEGVSRGGALVTIEASDRRADEAQELLITAGAVNVHERRTEWRREPGSIADPAVITPQTASEPSITQTDEPKTDPLLDIEVFKGGT